ncbi:MAG TPA: hypothetical protein VGK10_20625 [Prolixibacteraceae bacterium]|jgi:hypothetical protein
MMKASFFKTSLVFLLLGLMVSGCKKEAEALLETSPESINPVIQKEVNGLEFKFCLLNEKGEAATTFGEGENFTFQFSIQNKTDNAIPFYDYGFYNTDDFFAVRSEEEDFGKPFKLLGISVTKELRWILPKGYANFIVPWHEERIEFQAMHGYFKGLNQPYLKKGKYYTQFSYNFTFGYPNKQPEIETGELTFKINFEIK